MQDSTIVYVDVFAIKYDLVANARLHGTAAPSLLIFYFRDLFIPS